MIFLRHPIHWLRAYRVGVCVSSSAVIRGISNVRFGKGCRIGRQAELNASQGIIELGEQSTLGLFSLVESRGGVVRIGARTGIGPFCVLYGHGGLEIGNDCMIASHVVFIPENHRFDRLDVPMREQGGTRKGICVEDDVWLATQVVVLDGVRIGKGAVVGAGAVVTRDIPPYAIAHGVPARVISYRSRDNQ